MSRPPFFSIITPAYNHERYISACLESVLSQTFVDWEMIVIDDASRDGTAARVEGFARREPRIRLVRHETNWGLSGLHRAYNQGLALSSGKWVAVLEGDDLWPADKLAIQHEHCLRGPAVVCFGKCSLLSPAGKVIADVQRGLPRPFRRYFRDYSGPLTLPLLLRPGFIHPVTAVMRREALLRIRGFQSHPGLQLTDYPTFLELSLLGPFFGSRHGLGFYRRHKESQSLVHVVELTAREKDLARDFHERMRRDAANAGRTGSPLFSLAMKRSWAGEVAGSFWVEGRRLLALKKKRPARAAFLRGLKCEPVYLWFSARTLLRKAACLLAAVCIFLRMDPERWISWAKLRRKTLLQEAMSPEEP
jgi:glycosyltransferase involved in cell wall biosynthesis